LDLDPRSAPFILLVDVRGEEVTFAGRPGRMLVFL
jgi:hypothetical protein